MRVNRDSSNNECRPEAGDNFTLRDTLAFALKPERSWQEQLMRAEFSRIVGMWGPYEVDGAFYRKALERQVYLDSGKIKYAADDRLYRQDLVAVNCFYATSGLQKSFPRGGFLNTGLNMWGFNGTRHNLREYQSIAGKNFKEPIDIENDAYAFVYSGQPNLNRVRHPFRSASAYHR